MNFDSFSLKAAISELKPLIEGAFLQKISQIAPFDLVFQTYSPGSALKLLVSLKQGRTLGKPHALSVTEKTRVGAMHFFLHHIFQVGGHLCHDLLHELPAEGVLDGVVLLEF